MTYTIEKSIKLDEIESLTAAIVRFRLDRRIQGGDEIAFPPCYDRLFDEAVEKAGARRWLDILHLHPIEKMDQMLAYLYSEMELDRKHEASGTDYNGPTTDAIESAIKEYQSSDEYQRDVEEYRLWHEAQCNRSPYPTTAVTKNEADQGDDGFDDLPF